MPESSALSTGDLNAALSTTASAMPLACELTAVLVASTISATTEFCEPVHWYEAPSSLHASSAPYWVAVKNGFVVTWQTNANFQLGVVGKLPTAPVPEPVLLSLEHALSRALAASEALARQAPESSLRRVTGLRSRVSTASSTFG